jgi:hypothetical protein
MSKVKKATGILILKCRPRLGPGEGRASHPVESPPGLINGTGQFFPEDDRYSLDSRSLTAFSNYSERDSVNTDTGYRWGGTTVLNKMRLGVRFSLRLR